jgi:hypothetical protein
MAKTDPPSGNSVALLPKEDRKRLAALLEADSWAIVIWLPPDALTFISKTVWPSGMPVEDKPVSDTLADEVRYRMSASPGA